ncbi:MAG: aminotransferase class V-fold PLP-dependent enzyme [Clostridia bacterium]|nr:aminotransferase class V-fold PLP-dependent enzyme [Clostridia bacterium]
MIYLDNSATTHHKPRAVVDSVCNYIKYYTSNSGRGSHKLSNYSGEMVFSCRELIATLFNIDDPSLIAFTTNTTTAINFAVHGILNKDSHVVISGMEHNSVLRPVVDIGCDYSVAKADHTGFVSAQSVENAITPGTKLIIINHASNIVGTINPIKEIGEVAKKHNIPLMVDCAQTAGVVDIDVKRDNISVLAFAGHKLLYGPTGTAGLYVSKNIKLKPIIQGGTGTMSESYLQPEIMPDMLESGTLNLVGIAGLKEGVRFVLQNGVYNLFNYEKGLITELRRGLSGIDRIKLYGNHRSVGVLGFVVDGIDSVTMSSLLDEKFDIASRGGLHCAILAHNSIGTTDTGLVRLSVSRFNTIDEIEKVVGAIKRIL